MYAQSGHIFQERRIIGGKASRVGSTCMMAAVFAVPAYTERMQVSVLKDVHWDLADMGSSWPLPLGTCRILLC